jgi:hypothetical protein
MRVCLTKVVCLAAGLMMSLTGTSQASLMFTSGVQADFRFTAVPGNPLGLPDGLVLDFVANGALTFSLNDSVPNASSMAFTDVTGDFTVSAPGGFAGAMLRPFQFASGQLTSITRDGGGNITGGYVSELKMLWEMHLGGTRLYAKDLLAFNGAVNGAPFELGDKISGLADFDVFLDLGDQATDPLAVIGSNRFLTITAVPEPGSFALLGLGGVALAFRKRFRKSGIPG